MKEFINELAVGLYRQAKKDLEEAKELPSSRYEETKRQRLNIRADIFYELSGLLEAALEESNEGLAERTKRVDPDIFRDQLKKLVGTLVQADIKITSSLAPVLQYSKQLLDDHPITPARAVEAKYKGILREMRRTIQVHPNSDSELAITIRKMVNETLND